MTALDRIAETVPEVAAWLELDDTKSAVSRKMTADEWLIRWGRAAGPALTALAERLEKAEWMLRYLADNAPTTLVRAEIEYARRAQEAGDD
jgi:hypothetical protein